MWLKPEHVYKTFLYLGDEKAPSYFNGRIRGYLAFDSGKDYYYKWLVVINIAVMYNLIFIIGRSCFWELQNSFPHGWIILDYSCDFLYIIDMFVRAHEVSVVRILTNTEVAIIVGLFGSGNNGEGS